MMVTRAASARVRRGAPSARAWGEHAFFHRQLRSGGEPHSPYPLIDAASVDAQQAARHTHRLGRFQAQHRLELRAQRAVRKILQKRGRCGRIPA